MSVRTVKCPGCGATSNVPVGMANVKCGSCGMIWNVNQPAAARVSRSTAQGSPKASSSANNHVAFLAAGIGGLLGVLALVGVAIAFFVRSSPEPLAEPAPPPAPVAPPAVTAQATPKPPVPTYREVDLPESLRKGIYLDYRKLVGSSTEKKVMIMKDSPVNQSLQSMLGKTVDREITHFSLIHKISEDDVRQIIAEGDAKKWPGAREDQTGEPES